MKVLSLICCCGLLLLAGCGAARSTPSVTSTGNGVAFKGTVYAAGKTVSGSVVKLYAAGSTGNGSAPSSLLTANVITNTNGEFNVDAGYNCASSSTEVYLVATGGELSASDTENNSLQLMAALGGCGSIVSGSSIVMNEVTTVAAMAALAPFYSTGGSVGVTSTNAIGLSNAFQTAANLANVSNGSSPGKISSEASLVVSTAKLNTLANALSACAASAATCTSLFSAATSTGSVPTNTLDAIYNILRHSGSNVAAVFALASGSAVYTPALGTAPPDWMLYATLSGGGVNSPTSLAIDSSGNLWVADYCSSSSCTGAVSAFAPSGVPLAASGFTGGGLFESWGLTITASGNVWAANWASTGGVNNGWGTLTELSSAGTVLSGSTGEYSGGVSWPIALAADPNGNLWVANYWSSGGETVTLLNSAGTPLSGSSGWGAGKLVLPTTIAVDANHNAWVGGQDGNSFVSRVAADGSSTVNYPCCNGPSGIAADSNGNLWISNFYGNDVSVLTTAGVLSASGITAPSMAYPQGIAIDGAGNVWVANYYSGTLAELAGADSGSVGSVLSPASGYGTDASLQKTYAIAIDASGNLWVSNFGNSTLTQFIGVAAPVKTPLAGPPQQP